MEYIISPCLYFGEDAPLFRACGTFRDSYVREVEGEASCAPITALPSGDVQKGCMSIFGRKIPRCLRLRLVSFEWRCGLLKIDFLCETDFVLARSGRCLPCPMSQHLLLHPKHRRPSELVEAMYRRRRSPESPSGLTLERSLIYCRASLNAVKPP